MLNLNIKPYTLNPPKPLTAQCLSHLEGFRALGLGLIGHGNFCINREFGLYHIRQGIYRVVQGKGLGGV